MGTENDRILGHHEFDYRNYKSWLSQLQIFNPQMIFSASYICALICFSSTLQLILDPQRVSTQNLNTYN